MTFADIKANTNVNLDNLTSVNYDVAELQNSIQDAYDDIIIRTRCIIKKQTISFQSEVNYYDFVDAGIEDYIAVVAIFNNVTNSWLDDSTNLRQLDIEAGDWELTHGHSRFWIPHSPKYVILYPKQQSAVGTMDVYYWAKAPTVVDADTPIIRSDQLPLFEKYCLADLLESSEEFTKAAHWIKQYEEQLIEYEHQIQNLAKKDLLILI